MKKSVLKFAAGALLFISAAMVAQPTITPIAAYTNHPKGYVGNALYVLPNLSSNYSGESYDVGVTANYHFQCGTSGFTNGTAPMVLCKKDANTGAPLAMSNYNIAPLLGFPANAVQICRGMLLDETNNRIYLFGKISNKAVIACYNMTTLTIEPAFGGNGVQLLSNANSEATDAVLTSNGNFAVLLNEKDVNSKNFMTVIGITPTGGWMGANQFSNAGYECYGKRFRKYSFAGLANTYYIAGKAVNAAAQSIPMLWEVKANGIAPVVYSISKQTSTSFTTPVLGYGEFIDCDFLPFEVIAIGNNSTWTQGIWAKCNIPVSGSSLTPIASFKNGATLPGTGTVSNPFTRCLVDPDGNTIVSSYSTAGGMGDGKIGYITPSGNAYVIKYTFTQVHKVKGLMKDVNGNIVAGGCDILNWGITTAKFTCYAGFWGGTINKTEGPLVVNPETKELRVHAFPNPATNLLTVSYEGIESDNANMQVMDISGKKVMEVNEINMAAQQTTIDISDFKKGTYFIRLTTGEKSVMKKIVKQ